MEALKDELSYLLGERAKGVTVAEMDVSGLKDYSDRARENLRQYLALADQDDLKGVRCVDGQRGARRRGG